MLDLSPACRVLLLDDDPSLLRVLAREVRAAGFEVATATTARAALEAAVHGRVDIVVADLNMPELQGSVVLAMVARSAPHVGRVLMSGEHDYAQVVDQLAPDTVHALVSKRTLDERLPKVLRALAARQRGGEPLPAFAARAREMANGIVRALALRDVETEAHCRRVAALSARLAEALELDPRAQLDVELGALLHDVGKIGVRDSVLLKPGALTDEEWAEMRRHPELGARLLAGNHLLAGAIDVVLNHHERWQGGGYPNGLAGTAIPLAARIFQVADTYDAICSDRPYRKRQPPDAARAEVRKCSGVQFDPRVVAALFSIPAAEWDALWVVAGSEASDAGSDARSGSVREALTGHSGVATS